MDMNYPTHYQKINEQLNALTHGIAAILSLIGTIFLVDKASEMQSIYHLIAYIIFGLSLITLFLCSTLYHAFKFTKARKILHICDHSAIFLLIAGSFTPYSLLALHGLSRWIIYGTVWLIAVFGIIFKFVQMSKDDGAHKYSTIIYIGMGAVCILPMYSLYQEMGLLSILLLLFGCLAYLVGTFFYASNRIKYTHVIWHLFVMLGAACIYFSIFLTT